ncbi:MAG TPA: DUF512 domain-containing protein [Firmicutes bacterium]|nr:DUF512 domain-containing protein [Candidatus Fermentithermobacillaceae bacterium]
MQGTWCGAEVKRVLPGSPADLAGIRQGDFILEVNGERPLDQLHFLFLASGGPCELELRTRGGQVRRVLLDTGGSSGPGIEFSQLLFDGMRTCENHCVFCFLRQLPRGLRPSLYLRDDDYRLSLLWGNFITLTNLRESDWRRIERHRMSPLRVSVHALAPDVRAKLMGNPKAGRINEDIDRLVESGITVHAQVVLVRGWNDGEILDNTLEGLFRRWPAVQSCGVVPAVYTRWRKYPPSPPRDPEWSRQVLTQVSSFARGCMKKVKYPFVWAADEFYLMAGEPVPQAGWYRDFPQYENGIGLIADFRRSARIWARKRRVFQGKCASGVPFSLSHSQPELLVVTGKMAYREISDVVQRYVDRDERRIRVVEVQNEFFGPEVGAAGLLAGQDVAGAILALARRGEIELSRTKGILLPDVCLKEGENLFLDGLTVEDLEAIVGVKVFVLKAEASVLLDFLNGVRC